jgi:hypothetical protein
MMGGTTDIWNGIAPLAKSPVWQRLFSLKRDAQGEERGRIFLELVNAGVPSEVVAVYLSFAPLLHECDAIESYRSRGDNHGRMRGIVEVVSVDEALRYASADANDMLDPATLKAAARLLRKDPEMVVPPVPPAAQTAAWHDEAESMEILCAGDWEVACAAELPEELNQAHAETEEDDDFDDNYDAWLGWALENPMRALAIEQCCDDGVAVAAAERTQRLVAAPEWLRLELDAFWHQCWEHVALLLAHQVFWIVRAERGRRRGWSDWTPLYPLPAWWEGEEPENYDGRWIIEPQTVPWD